MNLSHPGSEEHQIDMSDENAKDQLARALANLAKTAPEPVKTGEEQTVRQENHHQEEDSSLMGLFGSVARDYVSEPAVQEVAGKLWKFFEDISIKEPKK